MKDDIALSVQNVSKQYRLGEVGTGTLSHDINRWWHKVRGKEDPYSIVGDVNDRANVGDSDYVWALKDINFEVKKGEILGIIGKNGAGKSTLLKVLSKVTGPTTGSIKMKGRVASLLEVGTGMHPELTGRENIYLNGAILGMTKAEVAKKLDEIVAFSGCAKYVDTPVKRYSSGMKVRLGFAVAAHLEPEILIVDEVLAVGDAEFQKKAVGKMQEVSSHGGRTVLFVSHNMASVKSLCTHGVVLEHGKIAYTGSADDAVSYYLKQGQDAANYSLKSRTDRIGNGKFKFTDIKILDANNNYVTDVISNEPVTFELHYSTNGEIDAQKFNIGLTVRDDYENNILAFLSDEMELDKKPLKKEGVINLKIDALKLRGESYALRLLSYEGKPSVFNALDVIENALILNVLPGDVNKIGRINRPGKSAIQEGEFVW